MEAETWKHGDMGTASWKHREMETWGRSGMRVLTQFQSDIILYITDI
jgi:hypothetical protein